MTITLDEVICASRGKICKAVVDIIAEKISNGFGFRKPKREKIINLINEINNKKLWHYVQTELIFFKNSLTNVCFFNYSKDNFDKFLKNLELAVGGDYSKIEHIEIDYKSYMRIFEEIDTYSFSWSRKKESILKAITPVEKTMNLKEIKNEVIR